MNLEEVDGRFGEAWAGTSPDGSHINLVIGRRGSPTAAAAAAAMADVGAGHTPFLLCLGAGNLVRPVTVVRNKTPLDSEHLELLTWGAAQLGIGQGVCDAVEEGLIPLEHVDDLVLLVAVYVDPQGGDHTAIRIANRRATRDAIADALKPDHREFARELVAARESARNRFYRGE
jgi:5,6,7,8-tetrahydromethanopterin hydro-lyase